MDDLQRQPSDKDREQLESRIKRVHDEGRIGTADRDIRLGNVRSAQSMTELDLMTRELERFRAEHPRSETLSEQAKHSLLGGPSTSDWK